MWSFFNPTIGIVTFRLRGWCMLGVFLLLAFTRLGHECRDLLSPCDEMHVCTGQTGLYSHSKEFLFVCFFVLFWFFFVFLCVCVFFLGGGGG